MSMQYKVEFHGPERPVINTKSMLYGVGFPGPGMPVINTVPMQYRKFLSNRTGASKRDIWTRAVNVIAPSLKY